VPYYTVALTDGWFEDGTPSIRESCGHKHRSYEAAARCRQRLLNYRQEAGRTVWSAKWHGSSVLAVDRDGRALKPELETA